MESNKIEKVEMKICSTRKMEAENLIETRD